MAQRSAASCSMPSRVANAFVFAGILLAAPVGFSNAANSQALGYASPMQSAFLSGNAGLGRGEPAYEGDSRVVPERLRRTIVSLDTREAPGTVIIDTGNTALYYVLGPGRAIRYGVGVGREGFTWSGVQTISRKAEWPDWHPPAQMIARQPYLPRFMAGGPGNPLGARAMYLGSSEYRIHGTNDPSTIGKFVSSGCIRLTNEDVSDLFSRVDIGTRVLVLPKSSLPLAAGATDPRAIELKATIAAAPGAARPRPAAMAVSTRGQAMNVSTSSLY